LAETCDQLMLLPQVSRLVGLPLRTLSRVVGEHCGMPPAQFMRERRMLKARARLLAGDNVTAAACEFGFWNLSVFARNYRAQFGELPSVTVRRCRSRKIGLVIAD
jgi:AraC family ethanolamine operon transcriptional activator